MSRASALLRSLIFPTAVGGIVFISAGTWRLPSVWCVLAVVTCFGIGVSALSDPELVQERWRPGGKNRDRNTQIVMFVLMLAHWILAGLDLGRFHWSSVPLAWQIVGLAGYALSMVALLYVMRVNRFYSSAVRIQPDRGQEVITTGPYRIVRHPGYAVSLLAFLTGGIAVGSWVAMIPFVPMPLLFVRRLLKEEKILKEELPGYSKYASNVKYRLIPGVF